MVRESRPPLKVRVENGVATLTGVAHSLIMRRAIVYTVASVPGVNKVVDQLMDDSQIDRAVAQALSTDISLDPDQVVINTYQGMVTLIGPQLSEADQNKAKEIIARIPGVREVAIRAN